MSATSPHPANEDYSPDEEDDDLPLDLPIASSDDIPLMHVIYGSTKDSPRTPSPDTPRPPSDPKPFVTPQKQSLSRLRRYRSSSVPAAFEITNSPFRQAKYTQSDALGSPEIAGGDTTVIIPSSDTTIYTFEEEMALKAKNAEAKRQETLARNKRESAVKLKTFEATSKAKFFDDLLENLHQQLSERNYTLADLLEYIFNPTTKLAYDWRWRGFFGRPNTVKRILGYWSSRKSSKSARTLVYDWALRQIRKVVGEEARSITKSKILQVMHKEVNPDLFLDFSMTRQTDMLRGLAPSAFSIFDSFSAGKRQLQLSRMTSAYMRKKNTLVGAAAMTLLKGASQRNNYAQAVFSTYFMATGAQRQHFSILGALGITMGYASVITSGAGVSGAAKTAAKDSGTTTERGDNHEQDGSSAEAAREENPVNVDQQAPPQGTEAKKNPQKKKKKRTSGLLFRLSESCRLTVRRIATAIRYIIVYDNINMMFRVAEQIVGRKNAQENGTCATLIPLYDVKLEDMLTADYEAGIKNARPLTIEDIQLNEAETAMYRCHMIHAILRVIVRHGGEGFKKFEKQLAETLPETPDKIPVHKTDIHPLPAMELDESSITGNVEVKDSIETELGVDSSKPEYYSYLRLFAGDQLTIARLRTIMKLRVGHEDPSRSFGNLIGVKGAFHAKIANNHGTLVTHFGKPNAGTRSPGGLSFHNTVLDRLPIQLSSLPNFRTCHDLLMVSLYGRVLHCLLLASGKKSLEEYAADVKSWKTLYKHAEIIFDRYANADDVQASRDRRAPQERRREAQIQAAKKAAKKAGTTPEAIPHVKIGDMVYENARLCLRDLLLTREFADAVKVLDSGRMIIILKLWACTFRTNGRSTYASEMLHLIHDFTNVWPKPLRDVIFRTWVVNPTGKPDGGVELDLVQEHLNFWHKKVYKADGDAHSWEWLAMVSPAINVLRSLSSHMIDELGADQGAKHGLSDLSKDIGAIMKSVDDNDVYRETEGRTFDPDENPAPDGVSYGLADLVHKPAIRDMNNEFDRVRQCRTMIPVSALLKRERQQHTATAPTQQPPPASATTKLPLNAPSAPEDQDQDMSDDDENNSEIGDSDDSSASSEDLNSSGDDDDSPTLQRMDEEDVDMDIDGPQLIWEDSSESEDESSDDEGEVESSEVDSDVD